jgi:imidazole glycerol-phosphate synthase subunit HisH
MPTIAVIDYDAGNLHSACKGIEKAGGTPWVTDSAVALDDADGVVLPGVGAWDPTIAGIRDRHLEGPIQRIIASGKPFLGICMGLQVLFESSEEGQAPGLGIVPGTVRRFRQEPGITIPNMGWHPLHLVQTPNGQTTNEPAVNPLWQHLPDRPWVYFVHSYYVDPVDPQVQAATITHGSQTVTAAIAQGNLQAVQFHPEKSADAGLQILANFVQQVSQARPVAPRP